MTTKTRILLACMVLALSGIAQGQNLFVSSYNLGQVERYNGATGAQIDGPFATGQVVTEGVAFSPWDGNLYVASYGTNSILKYNGTTGALIGVFVDGTVACGGSAIGGGPTGITFGPAHDD